MENRISELKNEIEIKEKNRRKLSQTTRDVKGICKNSVSLSKEQT
jgi:hypothetical protein